MNFLNVPQPSFSELDKLSDLSSRVSSESLVFDNESEPTPPNSNSNHEYLQLNYKRDSFKKKLETNLIDLVVSLALLVTLFYRINYLSQASYRVETQLVLNNYLVNMLSLNSRSLSTEARLKVILSNNNKFNNIPNYISLGEPVIKIKFYKLHSKCSSTSLTDIYFDSKLKFSTQCVIKNLNDYEELFFNGSSPVYVTSSEIANSTGGIVASFFDYLSRVDCKDKVDEYEFDCGGYHIDPNSFLIENYKKKINRIRSIKVEAVLFNNHLKQYIYVKLVIFYFITSGNSYSLAINTLNIDQHVTLLYSTDPIVFLQRFACFLLVCLIVTFKLYKLVMVVCLKHVRGLFEAFNLIDLLIIWVTILLVYSEIRIHLLFKNKIAQFHEAKIAPTNDSIFSQYRLVAHLFSLDKWRDLLIGFLYILGCLKILLRTSFTQIITHILLTFRRCLPDLVGFFVVCVCLMICYAFELHFLLGDNFKEFATLTKCFAALFRLIWGDIDLSQMNEHEPKTFYLILSYLVFMIILMFNLMLAIILGTYDAVKSEYRHRGASLKLDAYLFILFQKYLPRVFGKYKPNYFGFKGYLFCVEDVRHSLAKNGQNPIFINRLFDMFKLKDCDQLDRFQVEVLVENMLQLSSLNKPKLRINNYDYAGDYVSEDSWKTVVNLYEELETFSVIIEKRLDVVCDSILVGLETIE